MIFLILAALKMADQTWPPKTLSIKFQGFSVTMTDFKYHFVFVIIVQSFGMIMLCTLIYCPHFHDDLAHNGSPCFKFLPYAINHFIIIWAHIK